MKGAFQTSREIFENPIWTDIPKFRIFFYIYGNAVFAKEGTTVAGMHLKRGQFLRSYRNLREDLAYIENRSVKKYSLSVIKNKIDQLVKENRLKIESAELGTLFTVVNYEEYQRLDNYKKQNLERSENGERTQSERSENNNKNVKNVKKEEEDALVFFDKYIGMLSEHIKGQLIGWIEDTSEEIVLAAVKLAADNNATTYSYVNKILIEWHKENLKDIDQVRSYELQKRNKNKTIPFNKKIKQRKESSALLDKYREV